MIISTVRLGSMARIGSVMLLGLVLSACEPKSEDTEVGKEATADLVEPIVTTDKAEKVPVAPKATKHEAKQTKKKLDLSLSQDVMPSSDEGIDIKSSNKLPDMFGKQQAGTTYGAGILRDEENEDYVDSIQGAEVNIEFKID